MIKTIFSKLFSFWKPKAPKREEITLKDLAVYLPLEEIPPELWTPEIISLTKTFLVALLEEIKERPEAIRNYEHLPEDFYLEAVNRNPKTIQFIRPQERRLAIVRTIGSRDASRELKQRLKALKELSWRET